MAIWAVVAAVVIGVVALAPRYPGCAVLTAALGCTIGPVTIYAEGAVVPATVMALCFPALMLIVLALRGAPDREKTGHVWARWLLIGWGELLVLLGGLGGAIVGGVIYNTIVISALLRKRLATHTHVLATLAGCVRQNLPLVPALRAATAGRNDASSKILGRIADQIEMGLPLSAAIRVGFRACPGSAIGAIRAAERSGQTREALLAVEADMLDTARSRLNEGVPSLGYALLLIGFAWFLLTGLAYFIIPRFIMIFADFGVAAPMPIRWLTSVTGGEPLLAALSFLVLLVGLPIAIFVAVRPRRPESWQIAARLGDWLKWHMPLTHWFARTRSTERTAGALQLALTAGEPVDAAIETALCLDLNACYRRRLKRWLVRIRRGEPADKAARAAGVGRALAWAMDEKVNPGNAPAVLEMLQAFYHDAYRHWARVTVAIVVPLQIVAVAFVIGGVVYALYLPLFAVIHHTAETVMP